ncbi:MAG TPA: class I SAM-dependent methyltransferase [Casimicrobiaceae bacterium]|nr:class I SAM-dependent methyltransferase [Casimicrobiaceae bacterium]
MPDFDNPLQTWIARFARDDFLFGEEPNAFLRREAHRLPKGGSVLCVADGEGRNSVWLAEQGFKVTAFEFAPNAVDKARRLASRRNVAVDHRVCDIYAWPWSAAQYDAVAAIFIQFLPPERRGAAFDGMRQAVNPGGLLLLEGYRPEQVDYRTGGPPRREHMYTRDWLEREFSDWKILLLESYDAVIREGDAHNGMSALVDLVAEKPVREAADASH